jgi:thioredoxin reductase (NADPH)
VVGGGDAACDAALYLSRLTNQLILIHRREKFRAQKALADRVLHNPNIDIRFNTVLKEIKGTEGMGGRLASLLLTNTLSEASHYEEKADAVFVSIGAIPQTSLVSDSLKVDTDEAGYIITDGRMATSVPGLFAAGDVRASPFRQVVTAAGEGAVAAHCAAAYINNLKGETY